MSARRADSRRSRIACARTARRTRAATSNRSAPASRPMTVRVAVDAMGGDRGPEEVVAGAVEAAADGIVPVLYGPASLEARGLERVVAEQVIEMDDKPAEAVRGKPDSS